VAVCNAGKKYLGVSVAHSVKNETYFCVVFRGTNQLELFHKIMDMLWRKSAN